MGVLPVVAAASRVFTVLVRYVGAATAVGYCIQLHIEVAPPLYCLGSVLECLLRVARIFHYV